MLKAAGLQTTPYRSGEALDGLAVTLKLMEKRKLNQADMTLVKTIQNASGPRCGPARPRLGALLRTRERGLLQWSPNTRELPVNSRE